MEPFEFISKMQNAAFEVSYHKVIRRRTGQSLSGLLFESFVPPFKISHMIRFRHGSLRNYASGLKKKSGRAAAMSHDNFGVYIYAKAPALLHGEAEAPQATRFSKIFHSKMEMDECH
jgi:hypothetical protein